MDRVRLGIFSHKREVFIKTFPSELRDSVIQEGMEDTKESRPSIHYKADTHIISQRLWQLVKGLHGFVPDVVLEIKGKVDLLRDYFSLIATCKCQISFMQEISLGKHMTLKGRPNARQ